MVSSGKKYFVPYITAGFPCKNEFLKYLNLLCEYGDMVEIGIPFSDPLADGSDLQIAHEMSLRQKVDIDFVFSSIANLRVKKPLIIMSYLNPILAYGIEKFLRKAKERNVIGLVIPDMPFEEARFFLPVFEQYKIFYIPFATVSTSPERFLDIEKVASLFIYFVSVKGTTGGRDELPEYTYHKLKELRNLTNKKLFLGFGVKKPQSIKKLLHLIDGVIIGSEIARRILNQENIEEFMKEHLNLLKRGDKDARRLVDKRSKGSNNH